MSSNIYSVKNSWGDSYGNEGGVWIIGGRPNQDVVALKFSSENNGQTLVGTMTYKGEGPIGFNATRVDGNNYRVENSWGGSGGHDGGNWVIGYRTSQRVVSADISSDDGGKTLKGMMTYAGEGPIGFDGTQTPGGQYTVENSWGSSYGNFGGTWVIGNRPSQNVISLNVRSDDGGNTLKGDMTYEGEGPIGFIGNIQQSNNYQVLNSWGSSHGNDGGIFVLGGRTDQNVVEISITSSDGGKTLNGEMKYKGEGPIGFIGKLK